MTNVVAFQAKKPALRQYLDHEKWYEIGHDLAKNIIDESSDTPPDPELALTAVLALAVKVICDLHDLYPEHELKDEIYGHDVFKEALVRTLKNGTDCAVFLEGN